MATHNLEAIGIGTDDEWPLTGVSKWTAVNLPDDDNTTHVRTGAVKVQSFTVAPMPIATTINIVDLKMRLKRSDNDWDFKGYFFDGVNTSLGGLHTAVVAWNDFNDVFGTAPDGGAWTRDKLNSIEMGISSLEDLGGLIYCTTLYAIIDYDPAGGSCFKTEIGLWLPPLIGLGANLLYREIATVLGNLKTQPSNKEEFEAIKNALVVRPRFCFLGER